MSIRLGGPLLAFALISGIGCGPGTHEICLDECAKLNACAALDPGNAAQPQDCQTECDSHGIDVTSTSLCDLGQVDACVNAVAPTGSGSDALTTCISQVQDCVSPCAN